MFDSQPNALPPKVFRAYLSPVVAALILLLGSCLLGVLHTYVLYPFLTKRAAARWCKEVGRNKPPVGFWPPVHLLMSVHNEATVVQKKLDSLLKQDYRGDLHFHLASDASTDGTDRILTEFAQVNPDRATIHLGKERRGKPATINRIAFPLMGDASAIFVLTDASVLLNADTISELVRPMLEDPSVGVVDARMVHTAISRANISHLEDRYISREGALKRAESCLWGYMIGPFGGCFAIRSAAFTPVPDNFLVDDFYLCLAAYREGWKGISNPRAVAYEDVGQQLDQEFRRKRRIGAGNWQNLAEFRELWWPPWKNRLAYAFFSHKILRWLTPQMMLVGAVAWLLLIGLTSNYWATLLFAILSGTTLLSLVLPTVFASLGWPCTRVRALRYFFAMNVALLLGFFRYLNGIKTNVWQPSHRPQAEDRQQRP